MPLWNNGSNPLSGRILDNFNKYNQKDKEHLVAGNRSPETHAPDFSLLPDKDFLSVSTLIALKTFLTCLNKDGKEGSDINVEENLC